MVLSFLGRDFCDAVLQTVGPGSFGLVLEDASSLSIELQHSGCRVLPLSRDRLTYVKPHSFDTVIYDAGQDGSQTINIETFRRLYEITRRFLILIGQPRPDLSAHLDKLGFIPSLRPVTNCGTPYTAWERKPYEILGRSTTALSKPSHYENFMRFSLSFFRPDDSVLLISSHPIDALTLESNFKCDVTFLSASDRLSKWKIDSSSFGIILVCEISENELKAIADLFLKKLRADGRLILNLSSKGCRSLFDHLVQEGSSQFLVESISNHSTSHENAVVLSRNPLVLSNEPFSHPSFQKSESHVSDFIAFSKFYKNPWLYRSMVQMGERITDRDLLRNLALHVSENSAPSSADVGASLCVLGYDFRSRREFSFEPLWRNVATSYISQSSDNPHVIRWQISLQYLKGLFSLSKGYISRARHDFDLCLQQDPFRFSALLATKTVGSAFLAGTICVSRHDLASAESYYRQGIKSALAALSRIDDNAIGNPNYPTEFGFQEIAEISDMAAQCTAGLHSLPLFSKSPGLFWSRINLKRFGLATWALELKRENDKLRLALSSRLDD